MNEWTTTLRPGLPIAYDGEQFTVAEIEGRRILLRQTGVVGAPKLRQVDISALLAHPTPTDKPVERWFRTISQGLLAALPGYRVPTSTAAVKTSRTRRTSSSTSWRRSSASGSLWCITGATIAGCACRRCPA
jgi:hypothetical protein